MPSRGAACIDGGKWGVREHRAWCQRSLPHDASPPPRHPVLCGRLPGTPRPQGHTRAGTWCTSRHRQSSPGLPVARHNRGRRPHEGSKSAVWQGCGAGSRQPAGRATGWPPGQQPAALGSSCRVPALTPASLPTPSPAGGRGCTTQPQRQTPLPARCPARALLRLPQGYVRNCSSPTCSRHSQLATVQVLQLPVTGSTGVKGHSVQLLPSSEHVWQGLGHCTQGQGWGRGGGGAGRDEARQPGGQTGSCGGPAFAQLVRHDGGTACAAHLHMAGAALAASH